MLSSSPLVFHAVAVIHVSPFICSGGGVSEKRLGKGLGKIDIVVCGGLTEWDERRKEVMRLFKGKLNLGN